MDLETIKDYFNGKTLILGDYYKQLLFITTVLTCYGLIMVYSVGGTPYYIRRQASFALLGFVFIVGICKLGMERIERATPVLYAMSCLMILALKIGPFKNDHGTGCYRWLKLGPASVQVCDIVKIAVILMVAWMLKRHYIALKNGDIKLTLRIWFFAVVPSFVLYVVSSDMSSAMAIMAIVFVLTFVFTKNTKLHLICIAVIVVIIAICLWYFNTHLYELGDLIESDYHYKRIAAWLRPEEFSNNYSYQVLKAKYALRSGGLSGRGLGQSFMKLSLPEASSDMIFSILCEELGLVGGGLLILLYFIMFYLLLQITRMTRTIYHACICTGVLAHISIQAFINLGVNLNLLPNTGMPLPFISFGGTSVCFLIVEIGMVICICREMKQGWRKRIDQARKKDREQR